MACSFRRSGLFLRCLFRRGFCRLRLLGSAINDLQATVGKRVNARPRAAQIREHDFALAFVPCPNGNIARKTRALNGLTLSHAKRDPARNLRRRRRFEPIQAWIGRGRSRRGSRHRCAGKIARDRADSAVGGCRRLNRRRSRLGCLSRGRRGWCTAAIGTHQLFGAYRPLRTETDARVSGSCPLGLAEEIQRLGKPAPFVLVLKDLRPNFCSPPMMSAAAHTSARFMTTLRRGTAAVPECSMYLSLNTYFASSRWRAASPHGPKGYGYRPLA